MKPDLVQVQSPHGQAAAMPAGCLTTRASTAIRCTLSTEREGRGPEARAVHSRKHPHRPAIVEHGLDRLDVPAEHQRMDIQHSGRHRTLAGDGQPLVRRRRDQHEGSATVEGLEAPARHVAVDRRAGKFGVVFLDPVGRAVG
ncbi:hypothetical protein [Variovorax sp. PvP013]|uniref:hypothetical protein n=1 Tax=Variovorax sp. PvP013 TaxID=3156435 RepID=UPI003D1FEF97